MFMSKSTQLDRCREYLDISANEAELAQLQKAEDKVKKFASKVTLIEELKRGEEELLSEVLANTQAAEFWRRRFAPSTIRTQCFIEEVQKGLEEHVPNCPDGLSRVVRIVDADDAGV